MSDSHLLRMKRRLRPSQENMSPIDKIDMLEKTLSVFRAEVDMKLKIMQQILTTRNEQVKVQKKLLDREQTLYNTLLSHWKNTPKLATTGLSVDFSEFDFEGGEESEDNHSDPDPDYFEGDELSPGGGPSRKKSKRSLRRQRQKQRNSSTAKPQENHVSNAKNAEDENETNFAQDSMHTDEWEGEGTPRQPPVEVEMKNEAYDEDEDVDGFNEFTTQGKVDQETAHWNWDPSTSQSNQEGSSSGQDSDGNGLPLSGSQTSCPNNSNTSRPKYAKTSTAAKHHIEDFVKNNSDRLSETPLQFLTSQMGAKLLLLEGFVYRKSSEYNGSIYWRCNQRTAKCLARCTTVGDQLIDRNGLHNHSPNSAEIAKRMKRSIALKESETSDQMF